MWHCFDKTFFFKYENVITNIKRLFFLNYNKFKLLLCGNMNSKIEKGCQVCSRLNNTIIQLVMTSGEDLDNVVRNEFWHLEFKVVNPPTCVNGVSRRKLVNEISNSIEQTKPITTSMTLSTDFCLHTSCRK